MPDRNPTKVELRKFISIEYFMNIKNCFVEGINEQRINRMMSSINIFISTKTCGQRIASICTLVRLAGHLILVCKPQSTLIVIKIFRRR